MLFLTGLSFAFQAATHAQAQAWMQRGPGPTTLGQVENIADRVVAGAVNAIAAHPTDANTVYIGAVNGGIWKTSNALAANPRWVEQLGGGRALSIGALEFDPTDPTRQTLVAGAGRFSSFAQGGDRTGLWRTTNGGAGWTALTGGGTLNGLNISGVAARGATIVVSANAADNSASRGVWRSTNGGGTFTKVSGAAGTGLPNGAAFDLATDPSDPARLFTNAGGNGLYRSTDTGATWTRVSDAAMNGFISTADRVEIAVGNSSVVYVAIVRGQQLARLFRSADGGGTWTALDSPTTTEDGVAVGIHPGAQGGTHLSIAADPANAHIVYVGGDRQPNRTESSTGRNPIWPNSIGARDYSGRLFRVDASRAPGSQATHITHSNTASSSAPHADSRDLAFMANGDLLEADDGGIYRRTAPRTSTGDWFSLNGDLVATELHDVSWDSNADVVISGAQDTGTPQQQRPASARFQSVSTADGGDVAVDDASTPGRSVRFSSFQYFQVFRRETYDASNVRLRETFPPLTLVGGGNNLVGQFVTPLALNAVAPTRLVIGAANAVYESDDQGDTVNQIAEIVVNSGGHDPIAYGGAGNADMLYVGSGRQVFVRTAPRPAPLVATSYAGTSGVAGIVMDPANPRIAYVIDSATVSRTADAGATWTNVTGNLQTLAPGTLRSLAYSTSTAAGMLIVGTDRGVFAAGGPGFTTWSVLGTGLPRVPVFDLDYDAADRILVAGTLGRGAWTISLAGGGGDGSADANPSTQSR